jgi:serine/threonine-protein kinase
LAVDDHLGVRRTRRSHRAAEYPLPDPLQEPIPVLIGNGHNVTTESACTGGDFEDKFERTGD